MRPQHRQGWIIVATLFVVLALIFGGGFNTFAVFLTPLVNEFGWSRAQVSTLVTALALSAGLSAPLVGWLLDRVEARLLMVVGAALAGVACLGASLSSSYFPILCSYVVLGLGVGAATLLPCSLVVANWFSDRRGAALGVTFAGTSVGGMVMTLVANYAIAYGGWRAGYVALALPMLFLAIPLVLLTVQTRPPGESSLSVAERADALPGLELRPALRTRSFWMISLAQFFFAFAVGGTGAHLISYLIGEGYSASAAALVLSLVFGFTSLGKFLMGLFADRVSGRIALAANFAMTAAGVVLIFGAHNVAVLAVFVLIYGFALGVPLVLMPMVVADSLGLKRFGILSGTTGVFGTVGGAVGPVVAGWIYDVMQSYDFAFEIFIATLVTGALASWACRPLAAERSRVERALASA
jgi:MFS family permease